jgi:hypothetical protein
MIKLGPDCTLDHITSSPLGKGCQNMIKLSITVQNEESKLTEHELVYDALLLTSNNPFLIDRVKAAVIKFGLSPDDESPKITIKTVFDWQT